jgi:hypothetical protein
MKHLKLYEEFESSYFSKYYEELSADQYNSWRDSWVQGGMYFVCDDDVESKGFYQKIQDLCKSIIGDVSFIAEFERYDEFSEKMVLKVVICYCEDTHHRVLIRPFDDGGAVGFMVSIFGPDANPRDYTKAMGHFICEESETRPFEGFEQLLEDKSKEGLFTKVPKTPRSYKSEPVLKDEDFTERGIDNQMRAQFYKENGRVVRDLPREEALRVLDEWVMRNK